MLVENDAPLTTDELLLSALMVASFPRATVSKKHSAEKYDRVDFAKGIHRGSYNVIGYTTFQATKLLTSKQTNVYGLQETLSTKNT